MAFLLEFNDLSLDKNIFTYEEILGSVLYGRKGWDYELPCMHSKTIIIHRSEKIVVTNDLKVSKEEYDSGLHFENYTDYISKVRSILKSLVNNAQDNQRKHKYGLISTISTGYDATATSALAHEQGCNEVITFKEPAHDRGDNIARELGYEHVYVVDAKEFMKSDQDLEAEVCCTGNVGGANFSAFESITSGKLIFMGFRGDTMWDRINPYVNNDMNLSRHGFLYDTCLHDYEFCYRTNSVIIPLPMIGFDKWGEVSAISNSAEMKNWSINDDYDRPIPRRVVEEKGVRRDAFGNKKQGAGTSYHFNTYESLKGKMSPRSFKKLDDYKQELHINRWRLFLYSVYYYRQEWPIFANYAIRKFNFSFHFNDSKTGKKSSPIFTLLLTWGLSVVRQRYKLQ